MSKMKIKKGDQVKVVSGKESGKTAKVLRVAFEIGETGFDPAKVTDNYSAQVMQAVFEMPSNGAEAWIEYMNSLSKPKPSTTLEPTFSNQLTREELRQIAFNAQRR